jgi:hypothetical protein
MLEQVSPPVELVVFEGEVNTVPPRKMPFGALQSSKNVDLTDVGSVVARNGYTLVKTLTSATWAYSTVDQQLAALIDNGTLYRVNKDLTLTSLKTGVSTEDTFQAEVGGDIYTNTGLIISRNEVSDLRIDTPTPPQIIVTSGKLPAGTYQFLCTNSATDGRESGVSEVVSVELTDVGGFQVITNGNAYMTQVDGTSFFFVGAGTQLIEYFDFGYRINDVQFDSFPMPENAQRVGFFHSKLHCTVFDQISGVTFVFFSKPFHYHLWDIEKDFFVISGEARMLLGHKDALVIGSDTEINAWDGESLTLLASYGVPRGEPGTITVSGVAEFWTLRGFCRAMPFENVTQQKVSVVPGDYCAVAHIEQNGFNRFVALTDVGGVSNNQLG